MSEKNPPSKKIIEFKTQKELLQVFGEYDKNLKELEKKNGVVINTKGNAAIIYGSKIKVEKTVKELEKLKNPDNKQIKSTDKNILITTPTGKVIKPLSQKQIEYMQAIQNKDLVISIGPAGTGKTFLACIEAIRSLNKGEVERIILTRPVVEAGEKLGFLPGDLYEKVNPYLKPLYDAFYALIGPEKFGRYRKENIIEIVPLAYMRGRTLDDAIIILDEAQNTTSNQMQMFLTRLGCNSKAVITGDITQVDLEQQNCGLIEIQEILKGIKEVEFIYFTKSDVVRHHLVKRIIDAYTKFKRTKKR